MPPGASRRAISGNFEIVAIVREGVGQPNPAVELERGPDNLFP